MTKQHGRNPDLIRRITTDGARETVAVVMEDARIFTTTGLVSATWGTSSRSRCRTG
jgi:hypothetical protein